MLETFQEYINSIEKSDVWIVQIFAIVFTALLLDFLQKKILRRIQKKLEKTSNPWDDALVHALTKPLTLLIWMLGLAFALEISGFTYANQIKEVTVIFSIGWVLTRFISFVEQNILHEQEIKGKKVVLDCQVRSDGIITAESHVIAIRVADSSLHQKNNPFLS